MGDPAKKHLPRRKEHINQNVSNSKKVTINAKMAATEFKDEWREVQMMHSQCNPGSDASWNTDLSEMIRSLLKIQKGKI